MIYTTGTIAISGNTATGVGTNFTAPLSLIRVGCTLIAVGNPVQIFSITEIKSGTQLSVYPAANPAIPAGTEFSILLTDSISVDGLAQDVAETLRYYQGKETEIATAVEWWKEFGGDGQMDQLLSDIREETAVSTANAQKTEADKNAAAASKTAAANSATAAKASQDAAKASETAAKASQTAAKTSQDAAKVSETNAKSSETAANNSKNAAATSATNAATSATNAAASATKAATSERNAKTSETNAGNSASSASTSATAAANSAGAAKTSQDAAKASENAANTSKNAAKTSETNAAQSAADALNYRNQAQAIVGTDIGLGADRRDWPDCNDPTAYIGFCRAEAASAKNFPSIASGDLYLVGWLARGDGAIINGCFVGTVTRSLYTYKYNNADKSVAWTRHARKDEVDRLIQGNGETGLWGAAGKQKFVMWDGGTGDAMDWGVYDDANSKWIPLGVGRGGTGATTAAGARANLQLNRFQRSSDTRTIVCSTDVQADGCYLQVDAGGQWGAFNPKAGSWQPLAVAQGGTGARDTGTARTNLGLGTGNDPQFQNLKLTRKSDGTTGWTAGGLLKTQLYSTTDTLRVEGLVYAETGLASPSQLTLSIYTPSEGQRYFSFNTKGQILAETAIFRSTYANPLIIQSTTPTINFNETDRPSDAPYYNFIFDGGNWRIQKEGDGYNGEYVISYNYKRNEIQVPNLLATVIQKPLNLDQTKTNLQIPYTGMSHWTDYNAPEGAEATKYYPVIVSQSSYFNGDFFVEVAMRTRSLSGNQEPNCNAIHLWMRDTGWSDMGQACFGHYHCYASGEVAILCVRGTDKGQYQHNAIYVRGDAFPIRLAATVGTTITIPTADWSPSTASDSPTYKWGITSSTDGLDHDTYGIAGNLLDFTHGKSGFYSDKQFRHANGDGYLYNHMTSGIINLTCTEMFQISGKQNVTGSISSGGSIYAVSSNVTGNSFVSKLTDTSSNVIGQSEFRAGENQGQIVVRDLTSTAAHKFFNFNKDGTLSAPSGMVTHTGVDFNGQQSDNVNKFKPVAGQTNGPDGVEVYGGFHVGFSGNYGAQLVMRKDKAYFRTIEKGTDGTWKRLASMESGRMKVIGSSTNRESMDCNIVGYDASSQNMSWFLGQYGNVQYRTYFEDYLGGAGVELNGDDGSVKLYSGGMTTTNPSSLKLDDDSVQLSVPLHLNNGVSSKYLQIINDPISKVGIDEHMIVQAWGNGSDRKSVFEVKLSSGYIFYAQKNGDNSKNLQVAGSINCTTLNQSSDRDLKENIQVISGATEALRKMNGYTYTMKSDGMPYAGVIAQEAMEAIPEAVGSFTWEGEELEGPTQDGRELRETNRYLNVDYAGVTALLVQFSRETDDRVTALEEENASLRANISVMDERITKLEALVRQLTGSEE
ncbi:tail fiber domain-containing protein [Escherichia coli]|nr:tail fiber domain-containing protein [Escherichia coli]